MRQLLAMTPLTGDLGTADLAVLERYADALSAAGTPATGLSWPGDLDQAGAAWLRRLTRSGSRRLLLAAGVDAGALDEDLVQIADGACRAERPDPLDD